MDEQWLTPPTRKPARSSASCAPFAEAELQTFGDPAVGQKLRANDRQASASDLDECVNLRINP
jgi:hypothetical protein